MSTLAQRTLTRINLLWAHDYEPSFEQACRIGEHKVAIIDESLRDGAIPLVKALMAIAEGCAFPEDEVQRAIRTRALSALEEWKKWIS